MQLDQVIDLTAHPIHDEEYAQTCKRQFDAAGVLVLKQFLTESARAAIIEEGEDKQSSVFYTASGHNVYLRPKDTNLADDHPR